MVKLPRIRGSFYLSKPPSTNNQQPTTKRSVSVSFFIPHPFPKLPVMAADTIYLADVLEQMRTLGPDGKAVPFSISVRTWQRFSKTGGALKNWAKAKMVMKEENPNLNSILSLRQKPKQRTVLKRNPEHFENKTRNIKVLPEGKIRKIHIRLITMFNGKKVIY